MNPRRPILRPLLPCLTLVSLLVAGCQSSAPQADAKPNFGPPVQDARMEAITQQMEMEYNAAKNSRPTYQHLAEKKKREEEEAKKKQAEQEAEPPPKS